MKIDAGRALQLSRFAFWRLAAPAWVGIALLLGSLIAILVVLPAARDEESGARARIAELSGIAAREAIAREAAASRDSPAGLLQSLPAPGRASSFVADLEAGARHHGVQIDRSEYHVHPVLARDAQRYQVSFPARADYPTFRAWIEELLRDNPSLALDDLGLRRLADGGEELEARVSLSLYLKSAP
jgi:hypothetical protein